MSRRQRSQQRGEVRLEAHLVPPGSWLVVRTSDADPEKIRELLAQIPSPLRDRTLIASPDLEVHVVDAPPDPAER